MINKAEEKKVVSPFEFAIMGAAKIPDFDKTHRPETREEKETRLKTEFADFKNKIKSKKP